MTVLRTHQRRDLRSRGANGVVLIQTKRGSRGVSGMDYDTYVAAGSPARHSILTGDQFRTFVAAQIAANNLPASQALSTARRNTDWERALERTAY